MCWLRPHQYTYLKLPSPWSCISNILAILIKLIWKRKKYELYITQSHDIYCITYNRESTQSLLLSWLFKWGNLVSYGCMGAHARTASFKNSYSGTLLNRPHLGPVKVSLLEGWAHFTLGWICMLWDFSKLLEYRGGHISGVLIRGVPLYSHFVISNAWALLVWFLIASSS